MEPEVILEEEILAKMIKEKEYFTSVIHHLQPDYFDTGAGYIFENMKNYYLEYNAIPGLKELILSFKDANTQQKEVVKETFKTLKTNLDQNEGINPDLLLNLTEKFIKNAIFAKAIITGADALGEHDEQKMKTSFTIAEEAVKVSLTSDFGVELYDIDKVYPEFEEKKGVKLGIPSFDSMIGGGYTTKTLHAIMAASGVGKSAALCSFAVEFLKQGKDVVFLTLEMSEAEVSKRIYCNLYDIPIQNLTQVDKQVFHQKYNKIKDSIGNLNIKEFPAGSLTPLGIESYLDKLKAERAISSPIVIVDYLGILASDRLKNADNSYSYYGSIAEELRSIAQKKNIIMFSALQLNRGAVNNLESSQAELSESMKIFMTVDSAFIIAQTPDMKEKGEMKINFVKNRMSGRTWSFNIGYDYKYFRFDDRFNMGGSNVTNQNLEDPITGAINPLKSLM